jgi:glucoamylase
MRDLPVGNGSLLVNFDEHYHVRDIYFPHIGQENHTDGYPSRFGVWADGTFSWVHTDEWSKRLEYVPGSHSTNVELVNNVLSLQIICNDVVLDRENVLLRRIAVRDLNARERSVRLFFHHDFRLYENKVGDTAYYDPDCRALIHYKKHRYFLINSSPHFLEFATGRKDFQHSEGTWRDAEDGNLHGGAITEGSVDSTIRVDLGLSNNGEAVAYCWICAGTDMTEVCRLNEYVVEELSRRSDQWDTRVHYPDLPSGGLSQTVVDLYHRSLAIIETQIDKRGAIIAATDHDVTLRATDHYSYMWPRDGAFIANALDLAGIPEYSRRFFDLCSSIVHGRGYFLQKYNPDGSVGSGWHAHWDPLNGRRFVPIQEDETALVLWALGEHSRMDRDWEPTDQMIERLVIKCGDFLCDFRQTNGLPEPSWNLWEDRHGIHTFTCAAVVAGLRAAADLIDGQDVRRAERYRCAADQMVAAMREHLFSEKLGRFYRALSSNHDGTLSPDATVDASLFGIFYFKCFSVDDPAVTGTMAAVYSKLWNDTEFGGLARFENDGYMRGREPAPPNSWIITTLWLAEYYIAAAMTLDDLAKPLSILEWVALRAKPSGVLPEQIDPHTGEHRSVSPLTWSHSTFVAAVRSYLDKLHTLTNASTG